MSMYASHLIIRYVIRCLVVLLGSLVVLASPAVVDPEPAVAAPPATDTPAGSTPTAPPPGGGPLSPPRAPGAQYFHGRGFDTCEAPSAGAMRAWLDSDYRAVGVYFGGRARGCPEQRHLTSSWVRSVSSMGWRILPVYVGSQSPCVLSSYKKPYALSSDDDPATRGADEARDAVRRADLLGFAWQSALYLDMEAYDTRRTACTRSTLEFVRAWNREIRRYGYIPGYYSSAESGIRHMEQARLSRTGDLPSVIWYARWQVPPTLTGEPALSPAAWQPHLRIHQYAGNVSELHGGHRIRIDQNLVDAPVAVIP